MPILDIDDCIGSCTPRAHTYREGCVHNPYAGGDAPPIGLRPFLDGCVGTHDLGRSCDFTKAVAADPVPDPASPSKPLVRTLEWTMTLLADGYTEHRLADMQHQRWGWIINAGETGWTAHVGNFGQSAQHAPVLEQKIASFDTVELAQAKTWVENEIALQWRAQRAKSAPEPEPEPSTVTGLTITATNPDLMTAREVHKMHSAWRRSPLTLLDFLASTEPYRSMSLGMILRSLDHHAPGARPPLLRRSTT